ncbi:MAG: hypothetical protein GTO53_00290, partial [Planctomycetales bacterium]|nr:hypothetical protein [Planctomycetales bacterium]NIM07619.1 hypothetical protein [Planctomycetales bacterium]NIN07125.1 hypothetical protein [Planctomycetales bacterium]NIN76219.1 hypothetical protein [Planctomycetales bacterium]NIO33441.1 hypothetical protein [Planctomycetales bacterium]
MDQDFIQSSVGVDAATDLAQLLDQQSARADDFFTRERQRMQELETELLAHVHQLNEQLSQLSQGAQLATDLSAIEEQLQKRSGSLESAESEFQQAQEQLHNRCAELQERADQLVQTEQELDRTADQLSQQAEQLEQEKTATTRQRGRIASRLRARRARFLQQLDQQQQQIEQLQASRAEDTQTFQALSDRQTALADERDRLQRDWEQLQIDFQQQRQQVDQLQQQLAKAESQEGTDPTDPSLADDLQTRLDLAMKDIHELREKNAALQKSLEKAEADAEEATEAPFDWEAQKRRLLESLDGEDATSLNDQEKESLQEKIRQTDEIVAEKDRVIADLQQQLQSQPVAAATDTAPPAQEAIDSDAVVQQERDKLGQLQEDLREKMRKAEVEISLERAKLAREKSALQDKLSDLETVVQKRLAELQAAGP